MAAETSTVGAIRRSRAAPSDRSASSPDNATSSSERRYAVALPTRVWPWRRAASRTRYSSGWGTGVRLTVCSFSSTSSAVRPASSARRTDPGVKRRTVAPPRDSTLVTSRRNSASSPSTGPGTTAVRSACSRMWSTAAGSIASANAASVGSSASASRARPADESAPRATAPSQSASRRTARTTCSQPDGSRSGRFHSSLATRLASVAPVPCSRAAITSRTSNRAGTIGGHETSSPSALTLPSGRWRCRPDAPPGCCRSRHGRAQPSGGPPVGRSRRRSRPWARTPRSPRRRPRRGCLPRMPARRPRRPGRPWCPAAKRLRQGHGPTGPPRAAPSAGRVAQAWARSSTKRTVSWARQPAEASIASWPGRVSCRGGASGSRSRVPTPQDGVGLPEHLRHHADQPKPLGGPPQQRERPKPLQAGVRVRAEQAAEGCLVHASAGPGGDHHGLEHLQVRRVDSFDGQLHA